MPDYSVGTCFMFVYRKIRPVRIQETKQRWAGPFYLASVGPAGRLRPFTCQSTDMAHSPEPATDWASVRMFILFFFSRIFFSLPNFVWACIFTSPTNSYFWFIFSCTFWFFLKWDHVSLEGVGAHALKLNKCSDFALHKYNKISRYFLTFVIVWKVNC